MVVVYKFVGDLMFFVTGSVDENEIILHNVLTLVCKTSLATTVATGAGEGIIIHDFNQQNTFQFEGSQKGWSH